MDPTPGSADTRDAAIAALERQVRDLTSRVEVLERVVAERFP